MIQIAPQRRQHTFRFKYFQKEQYIVQLFVIARRVNAPLKIWSIEDICKEKLVLLVVCVLIIIYTCILDDAFFAFTYMYNLQFVFFLRGRGINVQLVMNIENSITYKDIQFRFILLLFVKIMFFFCKIKIIFMRTSNLYSSEIQIPKSLILYRNISIYVVCQLERSNRQMFKRKH